MTDISAGRREKHKQIAALPIFPEINKRIRAGEEIKSITDWVYTTKGYLTHKSYVSVLRMMYRYRDSLPLTAFDDPQKSLSPTTFEKKVLEFVPQVNELLELERLIEKQKARIEIDLTIEQNINKLTSTLGIEIGNLSNLLTLSFKMKERLGYIQGAPPLTGSAADQLSPEKIVEAIPAKHRNVAMESDTRARVLRAVELARSAHSRSETIVEAE